MKRDNIWKKFKTDDALIRYVRERIEGDYLTLKQKENICRLNDDKLFMYKILCEKNKLIWVKKNASYRSKHILDRPENEQVFDYVALIRTKGLNIEEANKIYEDQKDQPLPFFETWVELNSAAEWYNKFGVYYTII